MTRKFKSAMMILLVLGTIFCPIAGAQEAIPEGETALFSGMAPDALILLDLSGSMNWTPYGERMYTLNGQSCSSTTNPFWGESGTGHTTACTISSSSVPKYGDAACVGPFYRSSGTGHTTDCSRLGIAKRALFDILDDNDSNTITSNPSGASDDKTLNVRIGYMRFTGGDDEAGDPGSGNIRVLWALGSRYSRVYCNNATTCAPNANVASTISGATASGGTPLADSLYEARLYLDANKAADPARDCRQKFVILISDGADTYDCSGDGTETQTDQYMRRRATVKRARELEQAGYKVFVIGFGATMPHFLRNTLNWMAYWGGTDNPGTANSGNTAAYNPGNFASLCPAVANPATDLAHHDIEGDGDHWYALANDPGEIPLSGYAFLASDAAQLTEALKYAINVIREATYSFSQASISATRTADENFIYEGSFQPVSNDPFWLGHLKKYQIEADGNVGAQLWDAGQVLAAADAANRRMWTYKAGSITEFTTTNITPEDLGLAAGATTQRDDIVGYFRGDAAFNPEGWKLGDIFRASPVTVGTPSAYYSDTRDSSNPTAFDSFRTSHQRTSLLGNRLIFVGANDGQFHAFRTSDGNEMWSFLPPNLLPKFKNIAHKTHPTTITTHQYFVDGPITVAEIWQGIGSGTTKSEAEWETFLIFGEGRGASPNLWSSSTSCDGGFSSTYSATFSNYCGYYAFNVTNTMANPPVFKWLLKPGSTDAPYLGEPWSRFYIGRIYDNGLEKWVGFVGGGYNNSDCAVGGECDTRGKGFFVVDLRTGQILRSLTLGSNANMKYSMPTSPALVDVDSDGFVDTAYIGDLGGNVWRFRLCSAEDIHNNPGCGIGNSTVSLFFDSSTGSIRPIYTTPAVAKDGSGTVWVYFGTGDKSEPTAANAQEKFFGIKDRTLASTYGLGDLQNITTGTYNDYTKAGWYMNLNGQGEKVLADPTVFGGVVYFTTYTPANGGDPCSQAGTASLYGVTYTAGGGVFSGTRSMSLGLGIPTAPIFSAGPTGQWGIYVTTSGGGGLDKSTNLIPYNPPGAANRVNLILWRDRRF